MKMAIGDIVDRYTICLLKQERLGLDNSKELSELKVEIDKYADYDMAPYIDSLYTINGKIWDLEADIRKNNIELLGFEEIGRRAINIRDFNNERVTTKNTLNSLMQEGFIEYKGNHGSERALSIVVSLTTVPERLRETHELGFPAVLQSLCVQTDTDYEIHLNLPWVYKQTMEEYTIPSWLHDLTLRYSHLKIFRVDDVGPPTKFLPTLARVTPDTVVVVVDDDLIYHTELVAEHRKHQAIHGDVIAYDGRGASDRKYEDLRDSFVLCVTEPRLVHEIQHYKSVSYKRKLFEQDFFEYYVGRTLSDDVLVSTYFNHKHVSMRVVPYEPESHLYETLELWEKNHGVETFPIIRHAHMPGQTGCNHPEILKLQPKFYKPSTLGDTDISSEVPQPSIPIMQINTTSTDNFLQALRTYDVGSPKLRIGNAHDGGYVINEIIAQHTKKLISVGMGMEDLFEQEWFSRYNTDIEAYDGTYPCNDLCHKNQGHVHKKIHYVTHNVGYGTNQIPLNVVIDGKPDVLLKVDTEGAEYTMFDNVVLKNVTGLLLEVHDVQEERNRKKLMELLTHQFSDLMLFHIHANSWGKTFTLPLTSTGITSLQVENFPHTLELSFIHKRLVGEYSLETNPFPNNAVDSSNNPAVPDIELYWVNSL